MIDSKEYDKIKFRRPNFKRKGELIGFIKGLDTEAYTTGEPFMCCIEDGRELNLKEFPACFFECDTLFNAHYGVYNLKYDSGAIIYYLPKDNLIELWEKNKTVYEFKGIKYTIEYIPHKLLQIKKGFSDYVKIWDIAQYYKSSLESASSRYLGEHKTDIETKSFTIEYVKKHRKQIKKYCVQDALLVSKLANYLKDKLFEFGIKTPALYSGASLSLRYYADRGNICTAYKYFTTEPELLKMAMDSYEGGKFEITARGFFPETYEYDITSAYPYHISNLYDLTLSRHFRSAKYYKDATYGFLKVTIDNREGKYLPCGIKRKQLKIKGDSAKKELRIYPAGIYTLHCTKEEYEFMTQELNLDVKIHDAWWIKCLLPKKIYKERTENIFALKSKYKNKDDMLYSVTKIMANSFYGKTVQLIEDWKGVFNAGQGFNPIYGSIITANTRIQVARLQNLYKEDCLAVHTDSVIMKCKLDEKYITGKLGGFEYVTEGECILIACGQYSLNDKSAYKGFKPTIVKNNDDEMRVESWREILSKNKSKYVIKYPKKKTECWCEAISKGHFDRINLFYDDTKDIDLNCDLKRNWPNLMKAGDFLCKSQQSMPLIVIER